MRTKISAANPFGAGRYAFAWEQVPAGAGAHLDYGCNRGMFLAALRGKKAELMGVDVSREAIAAGRQEYPGLDLRHLSDGVIPEVPGGFGSISLLDVLEHVPDQRGLLRQLLERLAPAGVLIVTVPGRHLFSFLDLGNLKFIFPRLHRWHFRRKLGAAQYAQRYESNPDGLIGDVSADKKWHEHFSPRKLGKLLAECGFSVRAQDGAGYFGRVFLLLQLMSRAVCRRENRCLSKLLDADLRRFGRANLFMVARK